jgi:hypothetical protein
MVGSCEHGNEPLGLGNFFTSFVYRQGVRGSFLLPVLVLPSKGYILMPYMIVYCL